MAYACRAVWRRQPARNWSALKGRFSTSRNSPDIKKPLDVLLSAAKEDIERQVGNGVTLDLQQVFQRLQLHEFRGQWAEALRNNEIGLRVQQVQEGAQNQWIEAGSRTL